EKVRILSEKTHFAEGLAMYNINLAVIYIDLKDHRTALKHLYKAKSLMPKESRYNLEIQRNLMKVHFNMTHMDSALYYYDLVSAYFKSRADIESNTYGFLSGYYFEMEDFKKAALFDKRADSVNEYIRSRNNENQLKFLEMEYNSKLHEQKLMKLNAEMQRSN